MPDLAAPAVNIRAARPGGGYGIHTGTSFAAPFVTGSGALLLEWSITRGNSPFLYGESIRAYLRKGARRTSFLTYPNPHFGYGTLCLENSLSHIRRRRQAAGAEPVLPIRCVTAQDNSR